VREHACEVVPGAVSALPVGCTTFLKVFYYGHISHKIKPYTQLSLEAVGVSRNARRVLVVLPAGENIPERMVPIDLFHTNEYKNRIETLNDVYSY